MSEYKIDVKASFEVNCVMNNILVSGGDSDDTDKRTDLYKAYDAAKLSLPVVREFDKCFENGRFLCDDFADKVINDYHVKKINGNIMFWDGKRYITNTALPKYIRKYKTNLSSRNVNEVLRSIDDQFSHPDDNSHESDIRYIQFNNGVCDLETCDLIPPNPDIVIGRYINHNYIPDLPLQMTESAYHVETVLRKVTCGDKDLQSLLEEMIGYCFYRSARFKKFFMLLGDGDNGKSVFLNMLQCLLAGNYSSLTLPQMLERFKTEQLYGALANLCEEAPRKHLEDSSLLKNVTGDGLLTVERKGQRAFSFKPDATLIFCANDLPTMDDPTGAARKRMIPIPFNAVFSPEDEDYDPNVISKVTTNDAMEYLVYIGVEGLKRLIRRGCFSIPTAVLNEIDKYIKTSDVILGFTKHHDPVGAEPLCLYDTFKSYCKTTGRIPMNFDNFLPRLCRTCKLETYRANGNIERLRSVDNHPTRVLTAPLIYNYDEIEQLEQYKLDLERENNLNIARSQKEHTTDKTEVVPQSTSNESKQICDKTTDERGNENSLDEEPDGIDYY